MKNEMIKKQDLIDIEIEFELTLLTYKVFSYKDVRSKFLGVRLLAVQSNTQSRSRHPPDTLQTPSSPQLVLSVTIYISDRQDCILSC